MYEIIYNVSQQLIVWKAKASREQERTSKETGVECSMRREILKREAKHLLVVTETKNNRDAVEPFTLNSISISKRQKVSII